MITRKSASAKGRRVQQLVRDAILKWFPALTPDDVRSTSMGSGGVDIQLSAAAKAVLPFSFEVKARKGIALIYDALDQAERGDGLIPVAVVKADRKRPLAVMDMDVFMALAAR